MISWQAYLRVIKYFLRPPAVGGAKHQPGSCSGSPDLPWYLGTAVPWKENLSPFSFFTELTRFVRPLNRSRCHPGNYNAFTEVSVVKNVAQNSVDAVANR